MIEPQDVRAGLFAGELFLEYLPVVALDDGRCVGAEALVRWQRGDRLVMPLEFIPAIENTPVAGLLTYWVIDTMAAELADWMRENPDAHIAINVPPEVLGRGGVVYAGYKANLHDLRSRIVLEITERGIPDNMGMQEIRDIAAEDVLIAMDDVAIDQDNLLLLSRVPVDIIKIDRGPVAGIEGMQALPWLERLRALLDVGRHLVLAEGVERESQERILRELGVQYAQGWLYAKSMRAAAFKSWFAQRNCDRPAAH
jgi:sensor c-di-GMP phosphodiesterase-like protein